MAQVRCRVTPDTAHAGDRWRHEHLVPEPQPEYRASQLHRTIESATDGSLRVERRRAGVTQASARQRTDDRQIVVSRYRVRLTFEALEDLKRLQAFLIE
jgi:DNA transposition AAA+ family ATPase